MAPMPNKKQVLKEKEDRLKTVTDNLGQMDQLPEPA
jgi:hypothetical protein